MVRACQYRYIFHSKTHRVTETGAQRGWGVAERGREKKAVREGKAKRQKAGE